MTQPNTLHIRDFGFIRLPELIKLIGLSKSSIWRRIDNGRFPKPINLGGQAVGWRMQDIRQWMENPIAYRHNKTVT